MCPKLWYYFQFLVWQGFGIADWGPNLILWLQLQKMGDRNSCQILQYLQKWITECSLRIADSSRQMMIFGHLVWGLIQVLRGEPQMMLSATRPWPSKNRPHGYASLSWIQSATVCWLRGSSWSLQRKSKQILSSPSVHSGAKS